MAGSKVDVKEGIVISRIKQKEYDAMVKCLGPQGLFSFYAHGVYKMGSKNASSVQEGAYSCFELSASSKGVPSLKTAKLIHLYAPIGSFEAMIGVSALLEMTHKCLEERDSMLFFPWLKKGLESLEQGRDLYTVTAACLAKITEFGGYGFQVDACVECGSKKDIVALDIRRGGLICRECYYDSSDAIEDIETIKVYRHAIKCPLEKAMEQNYPRLIAITVVESLIESIYDHIGIKIKALELLDAVV